MAKGSYEKKKKELAKKGGSTPASIIAKDKMKKFYSDFSHVPSVRNRKE